MRLLFLANIFVCPNPAMEITLNVRYPSSITPIYNSLSNGIHGTQHGIHHRA